MNKRVSILFMLMGIAFNVCLIASNLLETKVIDLLGLTATGGLVVFPISYIINDCVTEVWGYRRARLVIWTGFASNFLMIAFSQLAIALPAAEFWEGEESFNFIFGLAPRIAVASLLAFLAGSFLNAYVMSRMKVAMAGRHFSVRAIASTVAGEVVDSMIFFPIAFAGLIPVGEIMVMIATQAALKSLYEVVILPLTVRVVRWMKRVEGEDAFDDSISYRIF